MRSGSYIQGRSHKVDAKWIHDDDDDDDVCLFVLHRAQMIWLHFLFQELVGVIV